MWKKLYLNHRLKNSKGFTLIETVLSIFLISIISLTIFYLLNYSIATTNTSNYKDEILSHGRYGFEYIAVEIRNADKIIHPRKIVGFNTKYPENLGFIIYNYRTTSSNPNGNHEYTSYYMSDDALHRIKCRRSDTKYPNSTYFSSESGVNYLSEGIKENNTIVDFEANTIRLSLVLGNDEHTYEFESIFNINCPTDF